MTRNFLPQPKSANCSPSCKVNSCPACHAIPVTWRERLRRSYWRITLRSSPFSARTTHKIPASHGAGDADRTSAASPPEARNHAKTAFSVRKSENMKKIRSRIRFAAFCLFVCGLGMGCAGLYEPAPSRTPEPAPSRTPDEPPRVRTSERVERVVRDTGEGFGPYGKIGAEVVLAALTAGAWWHNRRALKQHVSSETK